MPVVWVKPDEPDKGESPVVVLHDVQRKTVYERLQELAQEEKAQLKEPLSFRRVGRSDGEGRKVHINKEYMVSQRIKQFSHKQSGDTCKETIKLKFVKRSAGKVPHSATVTSGPTPHQAERETPKWAECIPQGSVHTKVDVWEKLTKEEQQEKNQNQGPEIEDWLHPD